MAVFIIPVQAKSTEGNITSDKKIPHINIAIFHKLHAHDDFIYPKTINGADIIAATFGKAQFIAINHTLGLKNGDILNVSNDVLRDHAGVFSDSGVNCQISVHIKQTKLILAGTCQILMTDQDHHEIDHKGIIKSFTMHPHEDWQLIYDDDADGIAVYADENMGLE
ncbi:MAG: hypothetical protein Q9M11_03125 [Mariprofundaceae bacterium]|nr:hypothetical protein [Mariprofundaceae bacterium]